MNINFNPEPQLDGNLSAPQSLTGNLMYGNGGSAPDYQGPYEVTPTQSTQILITNGFKMTDNVTINPIPPNYGLITYNGSVLTVS